MSEAVHMRRMWSVLVTRLYLLQPHEVIAKLKKWGFAESDYSFRTTHTGRSFIEVTRWPWERGGDPEPHASREAWKHRDMSSSQAWKAFRMGVIASGAHVPTGEAAQPFWSTMRRRFQQWFSSYVESKHDESRREATEREREDDAPFNPPRISPP